MSEVVKIYGLDFALISKLDSTSVVSFSSFLPGGNLPSSRVFIPDEFTGMPLGAYWAARVEPEDSYTITSGTGLITTVTTDSGTYFTQLTDESEFDVWCKITLDGPAVDGYYVYGGLAVECEDYVTWNAILYWQNYTTGGYQIAIYGISEGIDISQDPLDDPGIDQDDTTMYFRIKYSTGDKIRFYWAQGSNPWSEITYSGSVLPTSGGKVVEFESGQYGETNPHDITFGFARDHNITPRETGWERHFQGSDGFTEDPVADTCAVWSGAEFIRSPGAEGVQLAVGGDWVAEYRPARMRVTYSGALEDDVVTVSLMDDYSSVIGSSDDYTSGAPISLDFSSASDILTLEIAIDSYESPDRYRSWNFDTSTTEFGPEEGYVKFNGATPATTTKIYINETDNYSDDQSAFLGSLESLEGFLRVYVDGYSCGLVPYADFAHEYTPPSPYDEISSAVHIKRGATRSIYNVVTESSYDAENNTSPADTEWNIDGWDDLSDVATRTYNTFYVTLDGEVGLNVVDAELVMHIISEDRYFKIKFTYWQQGGGGGFTYDRTEISDVGIPISVEVHYTNTGSGNSPQTGVWAQHFHGDGGFVVISGCSWNGSAFIVTDYDPIIQASGTWAGTFPTDYQPTYCRITYTNGNIGEDFAVSIIDVENEVIYPLGAGTVTEASGQIEIELEWGEGSYPIYQVNLNGADTVTNIEFFNENGTTFYAFNVTFIKTNLAGGFQADDSMRIGVIKEFEVTDIEFNDYYALTIVVDDGLGEVSPETGTTYRATDALAVSATPDEGYVFYYWRDNNSDLDNADSASTTLINPIYRNADVGAVFASEGPYDLTLGTEGGGTGSVYPDSVTEYYYNDALTISGVATSGSIFVEWVGGDMYNVNDYLASETSLISPLFANTTLNARFESEGPYDLTLSEATGSGTFFPSNPGDRHYNYNDGLGIAAIPDPDYMFVRWLGDVSNLVYTANYTDPTTNLDPMLFENTTLSGVFVSTVPVQSFVAISVNTDHANWTAVGAANKYDAINSGVDTPTDSSYIQNINITSSVTIQYNIDTPVIDEATEYEFAIRVRANGPSGTKIQVSLTFAVSGKGNFYYGGGLYPNTGSVITLTGGLNEYTVPRCGEYNGKHFAVGDTITASKLLVTRYSGTGTIVVTEVEAFMYKGSTNPTAY